MSDTDKRAMVPKVLCPECNAPMTILTSLASLVHLGMRELTYTCVQCRATKVILHRAESE
jgi:hypothetical protein